jgi:hypothetical protein
MFLFLNVWSNSFVDEKSEEELELNRPLDTEPSHKRERKVPQRYNPLEQLIKEINTFRDNVYHELMTKQLSSQESWDITFSLSFSLSSLLLVSPTCIQNSNILIVILIL